MIVHMLDERGLLHLDDAVCEYIPEFTGHGKERITIRHILLHRAGIPAVPAAHANPDLLLDEDAILNLLYEAETSSDPGRHAAYHAVTGGYILAEVIRRVSGRDLQTWLREEIREPLGLENFAYGVPKDKINEVAVDSFTGPKPRFGGDAVLRRSLGVGMLEAVRLVNDPRFRTAVVPSGNIIGTADEACRFFEMLLRGGTLDGVRCFQERTVRRATALGHAAQVDRMILLPIRYSLGFMLGADRLSFYGSQSAKAFGHLGFTSVLAWADPERDISVSLMNNGKPFISAGLLAWLNVPRTIARMFPRSSA
jgi:CubicO group peptidase (beta-lactamase class C family)